MNVKYLGGFAVFVGVFSLLAGSQARAQSADMVAQNAYGGGVAPSQDSILPNASVGAYDANEITIERHHQVQAAETTLNISAGYMHTQYHENAQEGTGDDESGSTPGFAVGAAALLPLLNRSNADFYTSLSYEFNAGDLHYGGHYLFSGLPASATDNAVFNRIEARLGVGFPLQGGVEVIPFIAAGYQAWNRNVNQKDQIGTDEFYRAGLAGGGVKVDFPVSPVVVLSATGEILGVIGGGNQSDSLDFGGYKVNGNFGPTAEERVALGLDYLVAPRVHVFGSAYWEHFNYAGFKPTPRSFYFYEPLSTTTQFGVDVGLGYSFF